MIPLRVLLIEDSEMDAGLILRQLKEAGYATSSKRIETKTELSEALKEDWDFIIADYRLPEFSATEALNIVKDSGSDTPFVIVSGAIGEETAVTLMKSGARDYIMKDKLSRLPPVVERELIEAEARRSQKLAHLALLESERSLRKSQMVAHIGHWLIDQPSNKTTWSDEFYRIMGLDPNHFQGNLVETWQSAIHPEDRDRVLSDNHFSRESESREEMEYRIIRPDGSIRYLLSQHGEPIRDAAGQITQYNGVVHDITERKMIELNLLEKMQESQNRAHELEVITNISSRIRHSKNPEELASAILQDMIKFLGADHGFLIFLDGGKFNGGYMILNSEFTAIPRSKAVEKIINRINQPELMGFFEKIPPDLLQGMPVELLERLHYSNSVIAFPIVIEAQTVGLTYFYFYSPTLFNEEHRKFVETVTEISGIALNRMEATSELEDMVNKRERELESIYKVTSSATSTLDLPQAFQEALELTLEAIHTSTGAIFLLDEPRPKLSQIACQVGDNIPQDIFSNHGVINRMDQVVKQRKALVVSSLGIHSQGTEKQKNDLSLVGLPMRAQDRVVGVLAMIHKKNDQVLLEEMTLLSFIADHLALVVENTRLFKKAERSAVLEERSRLARELHDSVTQSLYSANLYAEGARRYYSHGKYLEVDSYLTEISQLSQQALKDMRLLVYELRSPELKRNGLIGALQNRLDAVERRVNIDAEIHAKEAIKMPEDVEENLYRIAIECLNNSLKYAHASKISLDFYCENGDMVFSVEDNGVGFQLDKALQSGGVGLITMRERAERISANYKIFTLPDKGTRIEIRYSKK